MPSLSFHNQEELELVCYLLEVVASKFVCSPLEQCLGQGNGKNATLLNRAMLVW